jgi:quinol monooxygenase YgiN
VSIVLVATIIPKPEFRDEVIAALEKAASDIHAAEPGCLLYAMHTSLDDQLVMIEKYADQDAFNAHMKSMPLAAAAAAIEGKLATGIQAQILAPHPAGDPGKGVL